MTKKIALGRGLGALLPEEDGVGGQLREILVEEIRTSPRQVRQVFDQDKLAELAASIEEVGLVQPIVVRQCGEWYELVSGERRLRAFKSLGRERIPALVRELAEAEVAATILIENIQRENLNPVEEGLAYRRLVEEFELTQEEVARRVGKSRAHITNTLRLLTLPLRVQEILNGGALSAGHARALLTVDDPERQVELAQQAVAGGLSVRALEEEVRRWARPQAATGRRQKSEQSARVESIVRQRAGRWGERVAVRGDHEKGRLVIRYRNERELDEILRWLEGLADRDGD